MMVLTIGNSYVIEGASYGSDEGRFAKSTALRSQTGAVSRQECSNLLARDGSRQGGGDSPDEVGASDRHDDREASFRRGECERGSGGRDDRRGQRREGIVHIPSQLLAPEQSVMSNRDLGKEVAE